ncbi:MAG TPA: Asp-tRNA(Asn)/Glu-tRNA(Gln) amidotransferase subunit GatC [Thermoanaerobacterales bacterium]|nr:Asp-tRNA(Asn)/Glu-tRNA(Gln) amidotransferase subunit GatC [Thermoanaerobacterales bacterium]
MLIDKHTVECMAEIAHVHLSEDEKDQMAKDLSNLVESFNNLIQVDTNDVIPTAHPITDRNFFRDDIVVESLPIEDVLKNAPDKEGRFFKVPRIIEE